VPAPGPGARVLQGQGPPPRAPGVRRAALLDLPQWSGKTLADHRGDRRAWLLEQLGISATDDNGRFYWQLVTPNDRDYLSPAARLMGVVADRMRWKHALDDARRRARDGPPDVSATGRAA
jgi:hypothetical protein